MRRKDNNVMVMTTAMLQGVEIQSYSDAVYSTVVIGSGWLVEGLASWSDTFGARSRPFENKIERARSAAIQDLKMQAIERGCNMLLGLQFNASEINSPIRNMFMLMASATPAVYRSNHPELMEEMPKLARRDDIERLRHEDRINALLEDVLNCGSVDISIPFTDFCQELLEYGSIDAEDQLARIYAYAASRNREFKVNEMPQVLSEMDSKLLMKRVLERFWDFGDQILRMPALLKPSAEMQELFDDLGSNPDYELIESWMNKDNIIFETLLLLPMFAGTKDLYDPEDLETLKRIVYHLTSTFWVPEDVEVDDKMRITKDGRIVSSAAGEETISVTTLNKRRETVRELEKTIQILEYLFNRQGLYA